MACTKTLKCLYFGIQLLAGTNYLLSAQEYILQIDHFGIEEGLSHRKVNFSLQDQRGLMWFGTDYGLNRFDGYDFKWITKEKHGLYSNTVQNAVEDKDGLLWIFYGKVQPFADQVTSIEHIDIFNPVSETVIPFNSYFEKDQNFHLSDIIQFTKKENGNLVFLTSNQKLVNYSGSSQFSYAELQQKYSSMLGFHWSSNGYYWMRVAKEGAKKWETYIVAINEKGKEIFSFPVAIREREEIFFYQPDNSPNEKWISVNIEFPDDGYRFFEATPTGNLIPNTDAFIYKKFDLDFIHFGNIARMVDNGELSCFFSNDGFYIVDKKQEVVYPMHEEYENLKFAHHLADGGNGNIWVSTQFGIHLISIKQSLFTKILTKEDRLFPTRGLGLDGNGRIWIIEENNLCFWIAALNNTQREVLSVNKTNEPQTQEKLPFGGAFYNLILDEARDICYPSGGYQITCFSPSDFKYTILKELEIPEKSGKIWSMHSDADGKIWAGYSNGAIGLFGEKKSEWLPLLEDEHFSCFIYQFVEIGDSFWLTTDAGLFLFDKSTHQTIKRYWSGGEGKYQLPFDNLRHVYLEKDSTSFWLGTGGQGLIHFNTQTGEHQQFTKADGLSNNVINAVYSDDFDNLWLSSDYGIMRFNKTTHQVNTYLTKDGISHNEFNRVSHHQAESGTLFFGSLNGVTAFHPEDFQVDSTVSDVPLIISNFQQFVGDENKLTDKTEELLASNSITLAPKDPFFRLEFGLLTYEDVDKIQYAYKIEGQDQSWNYQKENYIRLSRLPYGNHRLRVKGQASNGQWSPHELDIQVKVLRPFYLKTWFLLLSGLALASLAISFYKWRTHQLIRQKAELEQEVKKRTKTISEQAEQLKSLEKLKSRFFANVSHELRTPLTLMSGPIAKLKKGNLPKETAQRLLGFVQNNSDHLLKLVNEILDLSKLETDRLEVKETSIRFYKFLLPLIAQFKSFGDSESVKLNFEYLADQELVILLDTGKFEKIVHNFLSNALKFTPTGGEISLKVIENEQSLLVSVTDTGTGIHPDDLPHVFDRFYQSKQPDAAVQGGTGIGLSLCAELAELLEGSVWVESELRKGSTFYFQFKKKEVEGIPTLAVQPPIPIKEGQRAFLEQENETLKSERKRPPHHENKGDERPTILIVEDNPELREYLSILLCDSYNITTAENGKMAWEKLNPSATLPKGEGITVVTSPIEGGADLIISDLMMPVMDGFQLLEKVKASDKFRHIPFIMLTARADIRVKLRALRIGVDDYITKPFVEEELTARIETLLRNLDERKAIYDIEQKEAANDNDHPVMAAADLEWLETLEEVYLKYLDDSRLSVVFVANKIHVSERHLHRQLKKLTGLSPNDYLREIRLSQARQFIETGKYLTVKETCIAVGFSDVQYFSKLFRQRFGTSPSKLLS